MGIYMVELEMGMVWFALLCFSLGWDGMGWVWFALLCFSLVFSILG